MEHKGSNIGKNVQKKRSQKKKSKKIKQIFAQLNFCYYFCNGKGK